MLVQVPPNMFTHICRSPDLNVNRQVKTFPPKRFASYSNEICKQIAEDKDVDQLEEVLLLSAHNKLHARWILNFYYDKIQRKDNDVIRNNCKSTGISKAIQIIKDSYESHDAFTDIVLKMATPFLSDKQRLVSIIQVINNAYKRFELSMRQIIMEATGTFQEQTAELVLT